MRARPLAFFLPLLGFIVFLLFQLQVDDVQRRIVRVERAAPCTLREDGTGPVNPRGCSRSIEGLLTRLDEQQTAILAEKISAYSIAQQGKPGERGIRGLRGPQGKTGPAGPRGRRGPKGERGDTGSQGPSGATGPRGLRGPAGPRGPQGFRGFPGPQGPQGKTGSVVCVASEC